MVTFLQESQGVVFKAKLCNADWVSWLWSGVQLLVSGLFSLVEIFWQLTHFCFFPFGAIFAWCKCFFKNTPSVGITKNICYGGILIVSSFGVNWNDQSNTKIILISSLPSLLEEGTQLFKLLYSPFQEAVPSHNNVMVTSCFLIEINMTFPY